MKTIYDNILVESLMYFMIYVLFLQNLFLGSFCMKSSYFAKNINAEIALGITPKILEKVLIKWRDFMSIYQFLLFSRLAS